MSESTLVQKLAAALASHEDRNIKRHLPDPSLSLSPSTSRTITDAAIATAISSMLLQPDSSLADFSSTTTSPYPPPPSSAHASSPPSTHCQPSSAPASPASSYITTPTQHSRPTSCAHSTRPRLSSLTPDSTPRRASSHACPSRIMPSSTTRLSTPLSTTVPMSPASHRSVHAPSLCA